MNEDFKKGDRVEVVLANNVDGSPKRYVGVIKAWAGYPRIDKALVEFNFYTDQYNERILPLDGLTKVD